MSCVESEETVGHDSDIWRATRNINARKVYRPPGRPRGSLYLPWDVPIITSSVPSGTVFFLDASVYARAASGSFLPSVGTSVIAKTRSVCERFVVGWHGSDSVNVASPKNNASGIASENAHAARGFVKRLKYRAIQFRRPRSRRVVTQQNEFRSFFATALVAMTPRANRVPQGVATVVIDAAQ